MRKVDKIYGATLGCPQIVGTPKQVVDTIEAILEETSGDGFNTTPATMPDNLREFVVAVVPILQQSRVHGGDYAGTIVRDNL